MSGSSTRTISRPRRNSAWSSAISTRIGSEAFPPGPLPPGSPEPSLMLSPPTNDRPAGDGPYRRAGTGWLSPSRPGRYNAHATTLAEPGHGAQIRRAGTSGALAPAQAASGRLRGGFHQSDHTVVITPSPVHDAELVAVPVVEQEEIVSHQFHLQQGLVDRHRLGVGPLLTGDDRALALHLDRHEVGGGRFFPVRSAVAVPRRHRGEVTQRIQRIAEDVWWPLAYRGAGGWGPGPRRFAVAVTRVLAPLAGAAEPVLQLGVGQ